MTTGTSAVMCIMIKI